MKYEGTTYRPPSEADSLLLQVTVGCAHNRCRFCVMYRDTTFRACSLEEIEEDILEARRDFRHVERIFLVNGDAFVLPASQLEKIAGMIRAHFPECRAVTMYASIRNIAAKTDAELARLRELGVTGLYVGVESGYAPAVRAMGKGHTVEQAREHLLRLGKAGIGFSASLMLGCAGRGNGITNARKTAELLNETRPHRVWTGTLTVFPQAELFADIRQGTFELPGWREVLEEERELIMRLEVEDAVFEGRHPTNLVPVAGRLPRDREHLASVLDAALASEHSPCAGLAGLGGRL